MDRGQLIDLGGEEEQEMEDVVGEDVQPPEPPPERDVPVRPPLQVPVYMQQPLPSVWQPQPQMFHVPKIQLTPFWCKDPLAWFRLAEATFNRSGVRDRVLMFDLVLPAIPEDALEQVRHILRTAHSMADPYQELKEELVKLYTPNVLEQLYGIVYAPELGGQSPSQLMNKLLAMLPPGEPAGLLFKMHFLLRLPMDIRDQVAKKMEELEARELAKYADTRWHVRNAKKPAPEAVAALQSAEEQIEDLTGTVAALTVSGRGRGGPKSRGRGGGGNRGGRGGRGGGGGRPAAVKNPYICLRHCKFGDSAYHCDDPENCKWTGNGTAGGQ